MTGPVPVTETAALLAESPVWDAEAGCLLWADILRGEVHRFDPHHGDRVLEVLAVPVGAVAPRAAGGQVLAAGKGLWVRHDTGLEKIAEVTDRGERMNDGKCDPAGRWWAGTMTADRRPDAALYCLDGARRLRTVLERVSLSNGLGWNRDGSLMYYVDTPTGRVDVFDYDVDTGELAHQRPFVDLAAVDGNPDGLSVDADDGVWVAMAGGWSVRRYTAEGRFAELVQLPVAKVTSLTFGGAELDEMYVTTSSVKLSQRERAAQPLAGHVFRCRPKSGVHGQRAAAYAG